MSDPGAPLESERARVLALARRHGWNATAFQTIAPGYSYFFHGDGCVAYVDTGQAWVAAGAPIADESELASVCVAFIDAATRASRRCCFFATEDRFCASTPTLSLRIGTQPVWNPMHWPETVARHAGLREQLRRARAKKVVVRRVPAAELERGALREPVAALVERWHATRELPAMSFLVKWSTGAIEDDLSYFVAERDGVLLALARVVPVPLRDGWFIEHLVRAPDAPNGTVELLVDAVMHEARAARRAWLTLGLAPLAGEVPTVLRAARNLTPWLYDFEGLRRFKSRLRPDAWDPIFVSRPQRQSLVLTILDVLSAFTPRGLVRFGAQALARGPSAVVAALAMALSLWTAVLATVSPTKWFAGHAAVKWGWVGFDVLVIAGIVQLVRRPRVRTARVLIALVTFDALASPVEALAWNVRPPPDAWHAVLLVVLCLAPAFAVVVLRGARARLEAMQSARAISDR